MFLTATSYKMKFLLSILISLVVYVLLECILLACIKFVVYGFKSNEILENHVVFFVGLGVVRVMVSFMSYWGAVFSLRRLCKVHDKDNQGMFSDGFYVLSIILSVFLMLCLVIKEHGLLSDALSLIGLIIAFFLCRYMYKIK